MNTLRRLLSTSLLLLALAVTAAAQTVSRVEYYWDTDPGCGYGTPITGWSAANQVNINTTISTAGLTEGIHTLCLRSRSNYGIWSPVYQQQVVVGQQVSRIEYFYDTDPGYGQGRTYASTAEGGTVVIDDAQLSATGVSDGFHRLGLRARAGTDGMWSPTYWTSVLVNGTGVVQVEYFYDSVPSFGDGIQYNAFTQGTTVTINNAELSAAGVSDGFHRLGLRARSGGPDGLWSPVYWQQVLVNGTGIVQVEYFYDSVPSFGDGIPYTAFTQGTTVTINNAELSAAGISDGFHRLGLRARSGGPDGLWSPVYWQQVLVNGAGVTQVEYAWDDVPAYGEGTPYSGFTAGSTVVINGAQLSTAGLTTGVHRLALHAKGGNGIWSPTYFHEVFVGPGADYAEYYWDTDPGYGNGTSIAFTADTVAMVNLSDIAVPTSPGLHVLCLRARAGQTWSPTYTKSYCNAPTPLFSILGGDTVCQGEQFIILDESEGTTAQSLYYWDMESDSIDDYTVHGDMAHTYTQAGTYTLTLGIGSDLTCRNTYSRTVVVRDIQSPTVTISRDRNWVCEGTEVRFTATTQHTEGHNPQLEWYRNDTLIAGLTSDTIYLSDLRDGDCIRALVRVNNPCAEADSAWSSQLSMSIYSLPVVTMQRHHFIFTDETAFTLANRFQGTPAGGSYYLDGVEKALFNPSRNTNGLYEISYTYTNGNGCSSTVTDTFELRERVYYNLIAQSDSALHGSVTGSGSYCIGDTATLTALPSQYFVFHHWSDGDTNNPRKVEVLSDTTLTAYWLLVCPDTTYDYVAEACDSLLWNGEWRTESGEYQYTTQNSVGCDSVTTLHLTVKSSTSAVETVMACNSYVWHGMEYSASTATPTYTTQNSVGCDSITTLHLTVNHCSTTEITACDSYTWRGTTYTASGVYSDGTDTLVLTVNSSSAANEVVTACDSYTWHSTVYTASTSTPTHTTLNSVGCDSVTTLYLTVNSSSSAIETVTACDSYMWHGSYYASSTDTPTYTTQNSVGCDSVTTLHLTVNLSTTAIEEVTACNNYSWHGTEYIASTTAPTYTTQNSVGCDSVTTLYLTVNSSSTAVESVTACDSYSWHGTVYTASTNTPTFTSQNSVGCDSVTTLHLTVNLSTSSVETVTACDSYSWHGTEYTSSTDTPLFTDTNADGCPHATTLHLTVNHSNAAVETVTACNSYVWHGVEYSSSTETPTYTSENSAGCDSVTTLHLTINYCSKTVIAVCDSYTWRGTTYTVSGTYTDGTDTLVLTVNSDTSAIETVTACDSYLWHGTVYTASTNMPTFTSQSAVGCDSVTTLHLTVNSSTTAVEEVTACNNYSWHGTEYIASTTTPTYTTQNSVGCDSVTTLHLTVNSSSTGVESVTACDSFSWHGTTYTASTNAPTYTTQNSAGCDSVTTLHLTVNLSTFSIETVTACDSFSWHGTVYTSSTDTPVFTDTNAAGCPHVTTLHLTVNYSSAAVETVTACDSYLWHGTEYTASTETPTYTSENSVGCDSVTTLHLTLTPCISIEVTACDSFLWHDSVYTVSGDYTEGFETLHLTVEHSTTVVDIATACDSYSWHGTLYTSSTDTPTYTTVNSVGCDSVTTLHLTVNHSNTGVEEVTACNSYSWHGTTYTTSTDTPTYTSQNSVGCDSVTTLHLTVNTCTTIEVTACDSYFWNGTAYNVSGTYTDGIDTLELTVNYSNSVTETVSACDSLFWNGVWRVASGEYHFTTQNSAGCDSVTTLHLTVNHSTVDTTLVTEETSYVWHGETLTSSGTYVDTLTTAGGCDSVLVLVLVLTSDTTVGISELQTPNLELTIYPNPTTGRVIVDAEGIQLVEVYSVNGQLMATFSKDEEVDLTGMPTGTYMLRVKTEETTLICRVVKK